MTKRIAGMDGLRGLACLMVMVCHLSLSGMQPFGLYLPDWGPTGVAIFFSLSAFLLGGQLLRGEVTLPQYFKRRAFRILPLYWGLLAVSLTIGYPFAHLDYWKHFVLAKGHGHLWTIPVECTWYVFEPLAAMLVLWLARWWKWLPVVAFAAACLLAPLDVRVDGADKTLLYVYPAFTLGLAAAYLHGRWSPPSIVVVGAAMAAALMLGGHSFGFNHYLAWGIVSAILILGIAGSDGLGAMLDTVPLRFLGRVSFSAYLLHPWVFDWFDGVVVLGFPHHMTAVATIAGACAIATTLAISHFTYQYFEHPILHWVRRQPRSRVAPDHVVTPSAP